MQTVSLLNQPRAREMDVAPLRSGSWTQDTDQRAPTTFRQAYNRPALGDCSSRAGLVRQRVVARARGDTAERLHTDSAPNSPVVWCNHLGRHGASPGMAGDQGEHAALPQTNKQAASRNGQIE